MCLTCGQPFPLGSGELPVFGGTPAPRKQSSAIGWVLGLLGVFVIASVGIVFAVVAKAPGNLADASSSAAVDAAVAASLAPAVDAAADAAPSASASAKPVPLTDEERDQLPGNYTCSIDDTAPFPCRVSGGTLEKLAGSQRFRGPVKKLANGNLEFSGTFFCPFGGCTRAISATFVRQGPGRYVGRFPPNLLPNGGDNGSERVVLTKVR